MEDNKLDFERLTAQQIYNYMNVNATDEQKKDFKKTAFPTRIQKTSKKLFTADVDAPPNLVLQQNCISAIKQKVRTKSVRT